MTKTIYYFTGTGNSLFAARMLAIELGDSKVIPITHALKERKIEESDIIGVCLPNYGYRAPRVVEKFFKMLSQSDVESFIFTVSTTAGHLGNHISRIKRLLKNKKYNGAYTVFMPFNYLAFGDTGSKEHQKHLTDNAIKEIGAIANNVKSGVTHFDPVHKYFKTYIHPGILYRLSYMMIPKLDKQYWLTDECNGCGTCSKICPVGNIFIEDDRPQWNHNCEQFWACLHWCPKEAIQYGRATKDKNRYHHPSVSIIDMKIQSGSRE